MESAFMQQPSGPVPLISETRPDGTILIRQQAALTQWPRCMTERFMHWAATDPDRVWMAERGADPMR